MADASKTRMNLTAIKRIDPYAKDIVDSTANVAFYIFNYENNEWEKTDVEGAFFVYTRNAEPLHSIFINNRLNTTSFVEPITNQIEVRVDPPFLLYRNERSRIRGFWFYNYSECERICKLVVSIIEDIRKTPKTGIPKTPTGTSEPQQSVNIFSMLTKAQQEFQNNTTLNNAIKTQPDAESQSVKNFFAAAKPSASSDIRRLLSNSLFVEQLEKQQVKAPFNETPVKSDKENEKPDVEKIQKSQQTKNQTQMSPSDKLLNQLGLLNSLKNTELESENDQAKDPCPSNEIRRLLTKSLFVDQVERQQVKTPFKEAPIKSDKENEKPDVDKSQKKHQTKNPSLMSPSAKLLNKLGLLTGLKENDLEVEGDQQKDVSPQFEQQLCAPAKPALMPPTMFERPLKHNKLTESQNLLNPVKPLTQSQLVTTICYLMKNDSEFVRKIHEAYMKQFSDSPEIFMDC